MAEVRIQEELPSTEEEVIEAIEAKHSNENKRELAFGSSSTPQGEEDEY
jgi:hypothetical protein